MSVEEQQKVALAIATRDIGEQKFVLAIRRSAEQEWVFPGGKIESFENAQQAARRELLEETGLQGKYPSYIGSRIHPSSKRLIYYIALDCSHEKPVLESGFDQAEWISAKSLKFRMKNLYDAVLTYLSDEHAGAEPEVNR